MTPEPATYPAYRFPAEVICHAVWLYHVFSLSLRDVELILAERGIVVTHESIRQWCRTFGTDITRRLRKRRPRPGDTWHMDEVFIRIRGELLYLWRAVDQDGVVLDILVQARRNAAAAKRFFRRLLAGLRYTPKRIVTDGLRSYGTAHREVLPEVRHRTSRYLMRQSWCTVLAWTRPAENETEGRTRYTCEKITEGRQAALRPERGMCRLWSGAPRQCAPFCWPAPQR
jgi:putative transposase